MKLKRMLLLLFILSVSMNLSAGAVVKITGRNGLWLTISKGQKHGVEIGMTGKVQKLFEEGGEKIPITLGIFIVKNATDNSAQLFIQQTAKNADLKEAVQVEFEEVTPPIPPIQKLKASGIAYIKKKDFKRAAKSLQQAQAITPKDQEIIIMLEGLALVGEPEISYRDYSRYKARNPGTLLLEDLKKKVDNTYPGLPPEKYLEEVEDIKKNTQGYYELEFKNTHVMVYIPEMELLVDKYEVANFQYLKFAAGKGYAVEVLKFSTLENYPKGCEKYPAIVSYEQAEEYCRAKGMRLPTEKEWERIAGKDKGDYPWGDTEVDQARVNRANFESLEDGYIDLAPVNSYARFTSPFGVVNMAGNVPEWVKGEKTKINKGGGFLSEKEELKITAHSEDSEYVGFRCVREVVK